MFATSLVRVEVDKVMIRPTLFDSVPTCKSLNDNVELTCNDLMDAMSQFISIQFNLLRTPELAVKVPAKEPSDDDCINPVNIELPSTFRLFVIEANGVDRRHLPSTELVTFMQASVLVPIDSEIVPAAFKCVILSGLFGSV